MNSLGGSQPRVEEEKYFLQIPFSVVLLIALQRQERTQQRQDICQCGCVCGCVCVGVCVCVCERERESESEREREWVGVGEIYQPSQARVKLYTCGKKHDIIDMIHVSVDKLVAP